jgi:hypothetical protein
MLNEDDGTAPGAIGDWGTEFAAAAYNDNDNSPAGVRP